MEDNNNKIVEEHEKTEEYKFNFINTPWDDRTRISKISITALLVTISLVTIACVINNVIIHYRSFYKGIPAYAETKCNLVKLEATPFVARIYSVSTQELLCLGAVIGSSSVIANGVCAASGPIRIGVGSVTQPQCKKGFTVDVIDTIKHEAGISGNIVLLTTMEKMSACSSPIRIADATDCNTQAFILGQPIVKTRGLKSLTRQPAIILAEEQTKNISISSVTSMKNSSMICVKELVICPVRAGDLLIRDDEVVGLASSSVCRTDRSKIACFANLNVIRQQLGEMMSETLYD